MTCTDAVLAQRAASTLTALAHSGSGDALNADAEEIASALPAPPAASFRETCQRLRDQEWPQTDACQVSWDQIRVEDDDNPAPARRDEEKRTPSEARLGQLAGKAFRVIQFLEYHVHDERRLLAAATADGWPPLSDEDDEAGPDDDLLDAVMHLADVNHEVPGADIICQKSTGEALVSVKGAELADWQDEPVAATFGGGWRLHHQESEESASASPDFAALFPVRACALNHADEDEIYDCEICGDWQLTPRTADMLHTALETLSDDAHDDADEQSDEPVTKANAGEWSLFDRLPPITWKMNADWRRQFGRACEDLARDLEAGERPQPRCTAEEMALHLAIDDAPGYLEMRREAGDERHAALPEHSDDYDWASCSDLLFEDHDVLMLFDASLDGFEDPGNATNQQFRVGDLRPTAWFGSFSHLEPRDPDRSFHR
jgi:hypothetical protein